MNFTMNMLGFIVEMERKPHVCPCCGEETERINYYRHQKIKHLKCFE
ncbi:transposase family protein [Radiobacillus deserti]|uniref:Transposase n=1 Tax=Radiobacillus deserti TaxID=2594883 RepID=A0A516KJM3_9BACI|nr:transposase [Radiobacillus deserti]